MQKEFSVAVIEQGEKLNNIKKYLDNVKSFKTQTFSADNLEQALVFTEKNKIDIILADLNFDNGKAFKLFEKFIAKIQDIPVLTVLNNNDNELGIKLIQAGAHDYILQSEINAESLVKAILSTTTHFITNKEYREKLKQSEEKYRRFIDNSHDMIYVLKPDGSISSRTLAVKKILGFEAGYLEGSSAFDLIHPDDRERVFETFKKLLNQPKESIATEIYKCREADGTYIYLESKAINLMDDKYINGVLINSRTVTKQVLAQQEIKENEERFKQMFMQHSAVKLLIDPDNDGQIIDANIAAVDFYGYTHEQFCKMDIINLNVLPSNEIKKYMQDAKNKIKQVFEFQHQLADGSIRDVIVHSSPIKIQDRIILHSIVRDITERKKAEQLLKENEERYRLIAENVSDVIVHLDSNLDCMYLSPSVEKITGYSVEDLFERDLFSLILEEDREILQTEMKHYIENQKPYRAVEYRIVAKNGSIKWIEAFSRYFYSEQGDFGGMLTVARDITERKKTEELKEDVQRMLNHDLKTPLVGILGFTDLLIAYDNYTDEKSGELLELINQSANRIVNLIDNSINLYSIETAKYKVKAEKVAIYDLLTLIIKEMDNEIKCNEIEIKIQNELSNKNPVIIGEKILCYSLFTNLIKNAVEASGKKETVKVLIRQGENSAIQISIWNKQPIPKDIRHYFGEKYYTWGKNFGTGLGVYSAKLMTQTQGGVFDWESSEENGTTVSVSLPATN